MKSDSMTDWIVEYIRQEKVATTDRIASLTKLNKATAAGLLTHLRKTNKIVGGEGLWALNNTDLNEANKIMQNKQTSIPDMTNIMNRMVTLGK
jgi:hypothetical protein